MCYAYVMYKNKSVRIHVPHVCVCVRAQKNNGAKCRQLSCIVSPQTTENLYWIKCAMATFYLHPSDGRRLHVHLFDGIFLRPLHSVVLIYPDSTGRPQTVLYPVTGGLLYNHLPTHPHILMHYYCVLPSSQKGY